MRMKRILFATDFSPCAESAYLYAAAMARTCDAELHVLHVTNSAQWREIAGPDQQNLEADIAAYIRGRLERHLDPACIQSTPVRTHLVFGPRPSLEIGRFAGENQIDLVVMGSSGSGGLRRLIHGSTAQRVLKLVGCPVMSVHQGDRPRAGKQPEPGRISIRHILVPVDFSDCSLSALTLAVYLAGMTRARVLAFHVLEDVFPVGFDVGMVLPFPDLHESRVAAARNHLRDILPPDVPAGCQLTTEVVTGIPALEILDRSQSDSSDLIVMGLHGKDLAEELFMGSVTDKVVRNATCPVISMPCPQKGT